MRTNREEIYATRRFTGHRSSDVPQRDRIYREGLVPAEFVRDQWGRMVKQLFSRWQVEADCMASDEKHCVMASRLRPNTIIVRSHLVSSNDALKAMPIGFTRAALRAPQFGIQQKISSEVWQ